MNIKMEEQDIICKVDGKTFRCEICGCNVFRHPKGEPNKFKCNGCGEVYIGEYKQNDNLG